MDRLKCLQVFAEVARGGSFVGASVRLGMSRASVTKHVAWLEQSLQARLFNRSTKRVGLTEAGLRLLDNAGPLLRQFEEVEASVREAVNLPRGVIRVGTPPSFGSHHLTPIVARFAESHPDIQIALTLDDGRADLIAEGLDLSIRIAPGMQDASHVAQPLTKAPQVLVAAPAYLAAQGSPAAPQELARHNCLVHTLKSPTHIWRFGGPGGPYAVRVRGSISANFGEALRQAALEGHGIAMHPHYMVSDDLDAGRLVVVLPEHEPIALDIYVIYSTRHNVPARVRAFLEFLKRWFQTPPVWASTVYPVKDDSR